MGINEEIKNKRDELKELEAKAVATRKEEKEEKLKNKKLNYEILASENNVLNEVLKKIYTHKKLCKSKRLETLILSEISGICKAGYMDNAKDMVADDGTNTKDN